MESKKKGQDKNPARFKIQYPMKNHNYKFNLRAKFFSVIQI